MHKIRTAYMNNHQARKQLENFTHTSEHNFNTESMCVMIENLTEAKSAFGITDEGEAVFFNARIVNLLDFNRGDLVDARCVPNYADKRDHIPWRCVRATMVEQAEESQTFTTVDPKVQDFAVIRATMVESPEWWTADELAEHLEEDKISMARIDEFLTDESQPLESTESYRIVLPV
jgi:hypothetical protein